MKSTETSNDRHVRLSREVRFSLTPFPGAASKNSWAGWPLSHRLDPWLLARLVVVGAPDPETGFVCNVTELDRIVRNAIPDWAAMYRTKAGEVLTIVELIRHCWPRFESAVQTMGLILERLELQNSPFTRFHIDAENEHMVTHTQQFEFSAAHRLFNPEWSDEENQRVFGKCNNPNGHGHNYVVEVSVSLDDDGVEQVSEHLEAFQQVVNREVIDRLDHKHLNLDIAHFRTVNPTVENIAVAVWRWLVEPLKPLELRGVRVYETPKTWAEYDGGRGSA